MGIRGPVPTPTALKVLRGNPGKRPLNKHEPKPRKKIPKCPEWMDEVAKTEWFRIVPELKKMGLLTSIDGAALEAYCAAYSRFVKAEQFIAKHGTVFKTPSGYIQQVPQVSIANNSMKVMRAFIQEFGLTPSSRARMTLPERDDDDPFF